MCGGYRNGKIGRAFINILRGFGMKILAYDLYPTEIDGVEFVQLGDLLRESDVISLHCPLTPETYHILGGDAFVKMKDGVFIVNTSRGALIESEALLEALNSGKYAGPDLTYTKRRRNIFLRIGQTNRFRMKYCRFLFRVRMLL